jgi:glycolate oxidase iron-sulfur subunit
MQTKLADFIRDTDEGKEADTILRKCVHCGFCTATCPTYQLLGDELDGPRGRIYLIKQILEGAAPSAATQLHLDRCLSCRSCETTCPSGVQYGRLLDIGRNVVESRVGRSQRERVRRMVLRSIIPYRRRFGSLLKIGQLLRPALPGPLKKATPPRVIAGHWPHKRHQRKMLILNGCAQPAIAPDINAATARVLDQLGIELVSVEDGCCGALSYHLSAHEEALDFMRRNIDAWWPQIEGGAEAIVMTASGCGVMVKDYGHLLRHDPAYAKKAATVSQITRDISEILGMEDLSVLKPDVKRRVAFQSSCTLQHGQQLSGRVEQILGSLGFSLTPVPEGHLCCGSAGSYSILQPEIAGQLKSRKLKALESGQPDVIATANIGCLVHLQGDAEVPVLHWINLVAEI